MDTTTLAQLKRAACDAVEQRRVELLAVSHEIHAAPELAFEEHQAAALLSTTLRNSGLDVQEAAFGLETAFVTEFGAASGPRVALLAEYDALPELGHACGHNLIATAALGAGLALASLRERLPGRVRVLGTPAEERGGGKELMARAGAFKEVDAALMIHPSSVDLVTMPCVAMTEAEVTYRGRAAHAAAMPEQGINALDALVLAYQSIAQLRQHIQSNERLHGIITHGGDAPNIVPERASGRFYIRAANAEALEALRARVAGCFEAGARATGADLELQWSDVDYLDLRRNSPLEEAFQRNAEALGRTFFPIEQLPASLAGSTDMGNISHRVPSIHPMLASAPLHCTIHNPEFSDHARAPIGDRAAIDGAKALAMTALDVLFDADVRERAHAIFEAGGSALSTQR